MGKESKSAETLGYIFGFFYSFNYLIGGFFVSIPYVFYHSGLLATLITFLVLGGIVAITNSYVLETMGRVRALEEWRTGSFYEEVAELGSKHSELDRRRSVFRLPTHRKYELNELAGVLFGKVGNFSIMAFAVVTLFFTEWNYSIQAGTSFAANVPINTSTFCTCKESEFRETGLPSGPCLNLYRLGLSLFWLVASLLSILQLRDQKYIQALLALLRMAFILIVSVFAVFVIIQQSGNSPHDGAHNESSQNSTQTEVLQDEEDIVFRFNAFYWMNSPSILLNSYTIIAFIPTFLYVSRNKSTLSLRLTINNVIIFLVLSTMSILVAFAFLCEINENFTINWARYTSPSYPVSVQTLAHFVIFYPMVDVLSSYPTVILIHSNYVFELLFSKDTSQLVDSSSRYKLVHAVIKLLMNFPPIIGSFFLSNLVTLLTWAGVMNFIVFYYLPCVLQWKSQLDCVRTFQLRNRAKKSCSVLKNLFIVEAPTPDSTFLSSYFVNISLLTIGTFVLSLTIFGHLV